MFNSTQNTYLFMSISKLTNPCKEQNPCKIYFLRTSKLKGSRGEEKKNINFDIYKIITFIKMFSI